MRPAQLDILVALLTASRTERSRCRDAATRQCWDHAHGFIRELLADYQRTGCTDRVAPRIDEYLASRGPAHPVTTTFARELARLRKTRGARR